MHYKNVHTHPGSASHEGHLWERGGSPARYKRCALCASMCVLCVLSAHELYLALKVKQVGQVLVYFFVRLKGMQKNVRCKPMGFFPELFDGTVLTAAGFTHLSVLGMVHSTRDHERPASTSTAGGPASLLPHLQ